jgi:uncharacterized membrane protein
VKNKFMKYLIRGILVGNVAFMFNGILANIVGTDLAHRIAENFTITALGFLVIGIGWGSSTVVYTFDKLGKLQQVSIHAITSICTFFIVSFVLNWSPELTLIQAVPSIIISLLIFFAIWYAAYLYEKYRINKINDVLKKQNEE